MQNKQLQSDLAAYGIHGDIEFEQLKFDENIKLNTRGCNECKYFGPDGWPGPVWMCGYMNQDYTQFGQKFCPNGEKFESRN